MASQMIDIKTHDGTCDAYLSYPDGKENLPGVILYIDAIGLRQRIFDMADHIASHGYLVIAPNIFYRTHRSPIVNYDIYLKPENRPDLMGKIRPIMSELKTDMSQRDVTSFLKNIRSYPQVNPHKMGVVGYCMGGAQALRTAANFPHDFQVAASFHAGGLATDLDTSPSRLFHLLKAEVYIGHADQDASMPPEQIAKVKELLDAAHVKYTAEVYTGCHHGWTMKDLPAYNKEGEAKHWKNLFVLFDRVLKS